MSYPMLPLGSAAKDSDVERSAVLIEDKLGTDGADVLAVAGARPRPMPPGVAERAAARKETAQATQRMMSDVTYDMGHAVI